MVKLFVLSRHRPVTTIYRIDTFIESCHFYNVTLRVLLDGNNNEAYILLCDACCTETYLRAITNRFRIRDTKMR